MNPNTPEEPEKDGRDTAQRKRSMEIKPETKPTLPYYPVVILAAAGAATMAALAIEGCQRPEPIHMGGTPRIQHPQRLSGEFNRSANSTEKRVHDTAPVRRQDAESSKAGSAE